MATDEEVLVSNANLTGTVSTCRTASSVPIHGGLNFMPG
jgi:hypothetical protein